MATLQKLVKVMNEEFVTRFGLLKDETEEIIKSYLPGTGHDWGKVAEAMNYSFLSGGKRLRPIIVRESYRLFGGRNNGIISPLAAAIEMIHTYSLIHDDLPAMDNDDYRRGRLTNHKVYGEAMAILAGDGLLNYAFETAVKAFDACIELSDYKNVAKAVKALAAYPGLNGMLGGQVVDLLTTEKELPLTENVFREMDEMKTGALIECAFLMGAYAAGADDEEASIIKNVGKNIGIAFQIRDDILDITGDEKTIGKPVGSDARNGKENLATFLGLDKAEEEVKKLSDDALAGLMKLYENHKDYDRFLSELTEYLVNREK